MMDEGRSKDRVWRRAKRLLTPLQRYDIYLQLVRGEVTMAEAAAAAGVDRSTVLRIRQVAKEARWRHWPIPGRASRPVPGMWNWTQRMWRSPGYRKRSRKWP
jgi:hypothetical protein